MGYVGFDLDIEWPRLLGDLIIGSIWCDRENNRANELENKYQSNLNDYLIVRWK